MSEEEKINQLTNDLAAVTKRVAGLEESKIKLQDELRKAAESVIETLKPPKPKSGENNPKPTQLQKRAVIFRTVVILAVFAFASLLSIAFMRESWNSIYFDDIRAQITFLGFVVALAAYLAGAAREIVKVSKPGHEHFDELKRDLRYVTSAEQSLVVLGVCFVVRITLSPLGSQLPFLKSYPLAYTDHALVVCLGITILWLAVLHCRQWVLHA